MNFPKSLRSLWMLIPASMVLGMLLGMWMGATFRQPAPVDTVPATAEPEQAAKPEKQADLMPAKHAMTIEEFEAAIRKAMSNPLKERQEEALCLLAKSIDLADIPNLLPCLSNNSNTLISKNLGDLLFRRWAGAYPADAWACAQTLSLSALRTSALKEVLGEWIKSDCVGAIEKVGQQPEGGQKRQFMLALVTALAELDPQKAMTLAASRVNEANSLRNAILRRWSENDPAGAAAALATLPDKEIETLIAITGNWVDRDAAGALAWLKSLPGKNPFGDFMILVINSLTQTNPTLAADYLRWLPASQERNRMMSTMASFIGDYDIQAAWRCLEQFADDPGKRYAQIAVVEQWAEYDPKAAVEYGSKLPALTEQKESFKNIVKLWAKMDPQAACTWVSQQPEDESRNGTILDLVRLWARQAPADAGNFVSGLPGGTLQDKTASLVLTRWTEVNPQAAVAWVSRFPEGNSRDRGVESVIGQWAKQDPETAGSWIKGIAVGNARDNALAAYVGALTQSHDPSAALAWALDISNESLRVKTMESSAGTWLYRDPVAARAWVEKSTLPSETKQQLLKKSP